MKTLLSLTALEALHGQYESRTLDIKEVPPQTNRLVELIQSGANGVERVFRIVIGAAEDAYGRFDKNLLKPLKYPLQPEGMGQSFASFDKYRQHVISTVRAHTNEYFEGFFEIREIECQGGALIIIEVAQSEHRPHQNKQSQRYYIRADGETRAMDDFEVSTEITKRQQRRSATPGTPTGPLADWPFVLTLPGSTANTILAPVQYFDQGLSPGEVIAIATNENGRDQEIRIIGSASTAYLWLQLAPSGATKGWTSTQLRTLIDAPGPTLMPLVSHSKARTCERNRKGAITWDDDLRDTTMSATQVAHNGQIFGIETKLLDPIFLKSVGDYEFPYIPSVGIERVCEQALENYLSFMRDKLEVPPPYAMAAGLSNVEGYRLALPNNMLVGRMIQRGMSHSIGIENSSIQPKVMLLPFYRAVWDACGLSRPDDFREA